MKLITILACVALARPGGAQPPPFPRPDAGRLAMGTDSLWMYLVQGKDTTPVGTIVDQLTRDTYRARPVVRRTYRSESRLSGVQVDTLVDAWPTLLPFVHRSYSARAIEQLAFAARNVTGTIRQPTGDSLLVSKTLPDVVYNSASFDLILRASPLADGWRTIVPTFLPSARTVVEMQARVTGSGRQGGVECWRVDAEFTGMPVTFWIAKADRRLMHQVMVPQAGMALIVSRDRALGRRGGAT